jgi:DNA-binding Lrp family transcriptional regulator
VGAAAQNVGEVIAMVTAYVLIQTEVGKAGEVAKAVLDVQGVRSAEGVAGPYDVIALTEAHSVDELGRLVVTGIQAVRGIIRTLTCPVVHIEPD